MTYPLPRPATYEAGAGMDRKASLLGLLDAIMISEKLHRRRSCSAESHVLSHFVTSVLCLLTGMNSMTAITRNLPWFIKDLGVSIIGTVSASHIHAIPSNVNTKQECYTSLIENLDFGDLKCLKYSLSKILGIGIVFGGSIMKVPQVLLSKWPYKMFNTQVDVPQSSTPVQHADFHYQPISLRLYRTPSHWPILLDTSSHLPPMAKTFSLLFRTSSSLSSSSSICPAPP